MICLVIFSPLVEFSPQMVFPETVLQMSCDQQDQSLGYRGGKGQPANSAHQGSGLLERTVHHTVCVAQDQVPPSVHGSYFLCPVPGSF